MNSRTEVLYVNLRASQPPGGENQPAGSRREGKVPLHTAAATPLAP